MRERSHESRMLSPLNRAFFARFTLVSFGLILQLGLASSKAAAATVTKISAKKKMVLVTLDSADRKIFKKGTKVCFSEKAKGSGDDDDSSQDDQDNAAAPVCGIVKAVKKKAATIVVANGIKKIKKGFLAKPSADSQDIASGDKTPDASDYFLGIAAFWQAYPLPATPAVFNKLSYNGFYGSTSLWKIDGASNQGLTLNPLSMAMSFGGELEFKTWGLHFGGTYTSYQAYLTLSDYAGKGTNPYMQTLTNGSAIGLYADYVFVDFLSSALTIASGLDISMSTVNVVATRMDSDPSTAAGFQPQQVLFSAVSKANVLSLRLPIRYQVFLSSIKAGLFFGMNFLLPLTSFGNSFAASVANDPQNGNKVGGGSAAALTQDMATALGHGKASYSLSFPIGMVIGF